MKTVLFLTPTQHFSLTLLRDSQIGRRPRKETRSASVKSLYEKQDWQIHVRGVFFFFFLLALILLFRPTRGEANCWTETIPGPFPPSWKKEVRVCDSEHPLEDLIREGLGAAADLSRLTEACVANGQITRSRNLAGVPLRPAQKHYLRPHFGDLVDKVSVRYDANLNDKIFVDHSAAQTYGYDIFVASSYRGLSAQQIVLLAHELQHSRQYEQAGGDLYGFCHNYMRGFLEGLPIPGNKYENNPLEQEAFQTDENFARELERSLQPRGREICERFPDNCYEHPNTSIGNQRTLPKIETPLPYPFLNDGLFRTVNDWAIAFGYAGAFPSFYRDSDGATGTVLIERGWADWRDIPAAELNHPRTPEERFQAVNDWASKNDYAGAFPNFHQADYGEGIVYGTILISRGAADWRDIPAAELGYPRTPEERFQAVNDWASKNGYVGAFPNFHQADYGNGVVYGTILLKEGPASYKYIQSPSLPFDDSLFRAVNDWASDFGYAGGFPSFYRDSDGATGTVLIQQGWADWRDISAAELGYPSTSDERFRAVNNWASANGYVGAFLNFHQADYGNGVVYGTILLKPGAADWRDIPASELNNPKTPDERFRAVYDWAVSHGYAGAFPNFHQADYGNGVVYGTILLKEGPASYKYIHLQPKWSLSAHNTCHEAIWVSFNYLSLDDKWTTRGWWKVDPGQTVRTDIGTNNRYFYLYAESNSYRWDGTEKEGAISKYVISDAFTQISDAPLEGNNKRIVSLRREYITSDGGEWTIPFSCER